MSDPIWDRYCDVSTTPGLAHFVTVAKFRELLSELKPLDELWINRVGNLSIERDGEYIGFINMLYSKPEVVFFGKEQDP